jgi:hypothetical protein
VTVLKVIEHGTANAYRHRGCRCDRCRAAWARKSADVRERARGALIPAKVHGTRNGYQHYGCRCRRCTDAQAAATKRQYHQLREASR